MRCPLRVGRVLVAVIAFTASALAMAQSSANFTFEPRFPTPGTPVHFTDTSSGSPTTWLWSFGDPSSLANGSLLQNPTHTYRQPGTYSVTLIVAGGASTGKVVTVVAPPFPCPFRRP
jgi:PKD repeat protein